MAILSFQTSPPPLQTADFLIEIDYGPDENNPEELVVARVGQAAMDAWENDAIPPKEWLVDPDQIKDDWRQFISEVSETDAENVLVMTSNGTARFVLDVVASVPVGAPRKLQTASYGIVMVAADGEAAIESWNIRPMAT